MIWIRMVSGPRRRPGLVTRLYRMCYTSTVGFFMFTALTVYCDANNDTVLASNETEPASASYTEEIDHIFLTRSTWHRGFELCRDEHNMTMASADDIKDVQARNSTRINKDILKKYLPLWTYAFEITNKTTGEILRITSNDVERYTNAFQCKNSKDGALRMICCETLKNAESQCKKTPGFDLHLPLIEPTNLISFFGKLWTNTSRWVSHQNEVIFLRGIDQFSVRCLVFDENGELRTDNCDASHKTLCIGGNTQAVVEYVDHVTIPPYTSPTTKRDPSGRSSTFTKSPSIQDIKNTNLSTVNISHYPVQDKSDIWMDPQILYSIIAVGSVIVLAILLAVCCCCYRKRHKRSNERRKSARLADMYSDAADSIVMKETSVYEIADTSEYAIPDDAVKKARHRQSIGENEYDVISKSNKTTNKFSGNAYNHVTLVSSKDRRGSSNQEENTYDVTNYGKQNSVVLSPNDLTGNVYGDITIKTER